jgi:hypothetical protein
MVATNFIRSLIDLPSLSNFHTMNSSPSRSLLSNSSNLGRSDLAPLIVSWKILIGLQSTFFMVLLQIGY